MSDHRQTASEIIERMKTARPTCDKCETQPDFCHEGFEVMPHCGDYVKRCATCADSRKFPWADKLTPEAVAAFIDREPWRHEFAWDLADLKPVADAAPSGGGLEFL